MIVEDKNNNFLKDSKKIKFYEKKLFSILSMKFLNSTKKSKN